MDVRTFIAVELSEPVRAEIARLIEAMRREGGEIRWVAPENLHLTLKFLGEIEDSRLPEVCDGVDRAVAGLSPFSIALGGVGAFPPKGAPRVIWVGMHGGVEPLQGLQRRIEEQLIRRGFPQEDKPFSPHLTIGRVRARKGHFSPQRHGDTEIESIVASSVNSVPPWCHTGSSQAMEVGEVAVMKSDLRPGGPVYTRLAGYRLEG